MWRAAINRQGNMRNPGRYTGDGIKQTLPLTDPQGKMFHRVCVGRTKAKEEVTPSILPKQMGPCKAAAFPRREEDRKAEETLPERKRAPSKRGGS